MKKETLSKEELDQLSSYFESAELEQRLEYSWGQDPVVISTETTTNGCYTETVTTYMVN